MLVAAIGLVSMAVFSNIHASYDWNNNYQSYWDLGVKASTIEQKSEYIDKFVNAVNQPKLKGVNDALFFPTPNNNFDQNLIALQSLQGRLHDIQKMDPSSFQYQSAIQQITSQEQDEATDMLSVIHGSWLKVNHPILWNPLITLIGFISVIILFIVGLDLALSNNS